VTFTPVSGTCGSFKTGFVGLESFYRKTADNKQDYDHIYLTMQSEVLGGLRDASQSFGPDFVDTKNTVYAAGDFSATAPDDKNICLVPTMSPSEQNIPEVPAEDVASSTGIGGAGSTGMGGAGSTGMGGAGGAASSTGTDMACPEPPPDGPFPGEPATDIKIEWSNVKVFVTTAAPGTEFVADMKYSENIDGQSCEATYHLTGIWPVVDCGAYTFDDCGNLVDAQPDDKICTLKAAEAPPGSVVINPDLKPVCDPDLLVCVASEPLAELK